MIEKVTKEHMNFVNCVKEKENIETNKNEKKL